MKRSLPMMIDKIRRITRDGRWIPEIDGLRFIAIFSVVLFHFAAELNIRSGRVIPVEPRYGGLFRAIGNGDRGVLLFFVISGTILAMPFARHHLMQAKKVSLRKYYMRRVTRLEPPYMLSMLLFTVMALVYEHGRLQPGYSGHALASFFYLHNLVYGSMSSVNPVTWSLEVEIQFYLLAPLAMQIFRIGGRMTRRLGMMAAILAIGLAQAPLQHTPRIELSILYSLQYFLAGLLLADIFVLDLEAMRFSWMWDAAGLAALVFMYGMGHDVYAAHVLLPFAFGVLCLAAMRGVLVRKFVANPWVADWGNVLLDLPAALRVDGGVLQGDEAADRRAVRLSGELCNPTCRDGDSNPSAVDCVLQAG